MFEWWHTDVPLQSPPPSSCYKVLYKEWISPLEPWACESLMIYHQTPMPVKPSKQTYHLVTIQNTPHLYTVTFLLLVKLPYSLPSPYLRFQTHPVKWHKVHAQKGLGGTSRIKAVFPSSFFITLDAFIPSLSNSLFLKSSSHMSLPTILRAPGGSSFFYNRLNISLPKPSEYLLRKPRAFIFKS